jgi:hypothetical protein
MTTLPRPGPLDTQDGAGTELDLLWDQMADVVEATEAVANNAMPNTAAAAGALIAGAASKAAPDDADLLGLSDSAAGGVLKYLSWSNIKAALRAVFATLSGVAGGQTLTGGTAASETLTLRSTAHATKGKIQFGSSSAFDEAANDWGFGTTSPSAKVHVVDTAEQLRLGYDAATYLSMTVSDLGAVTYRATGGQYIFKGANATATLGSELVTNGDFTSNLSGWTDSGATWSWVTGSAKHTSGSISNLSQNVTVTSTNTYLIDFTISGRTSGNVTITLGAVTLVDNGATTTWSGNGTNKRTLVAAASGSVALTIVPSSTFDGSIDNISLRVVSLGTVTPTVAVQNSDASAGVHIRSGGNTQWNTFVGIDVGRSILSGYNNSGYGGNALRTINTGLNNTAVGYNALNLCTIGSSNTVVGSGAGYANVSAYGNALFGYISGTALTTGGYNCAYGSNSLIGATIGSYTTAMGYASLTGLTSGNNVTALGAHSGRFIADGATALATTQSVWAANTSVIGNSSTLTFKAFGTPIFTPAASFTPTANGELTMEATSNTSVTIKLKGTDGVRPQFRTDSRVMGLHGL